MANGSDTRPIIIKRKKVIANAAHHGGAWKVAYADFVTAMMAFFLLMWLVNATTTTQRRGLADYFSPTVPLHMVSGGGDGALDGHSPFANRDLPQDGSGATMAKSQDSRRARGETGTDPDTAGDKAGDTIDENDANFAAIEEALYGLGGESMIADNLLQHIVTRVTDIGLIIEVFDRPKAPLFVAGHNRPTARLESIIAMISRVTDRATNNIEVGGHLRAEPLVMANNPVWQLSSTRADRVRRMMVGDGTDPRRLRRVTGHADRSPAVSIPMSIRNNRIEIVLRRS
jgi:chemotaxis protein MotB